MTKSDTLIANLINALDVITREAAKNGQYFILGVAEQAISNVRVHQERNRDGYFVVKERTSPMEITIKDDQHRIKRVPTWQALQQIVSEALEQDGKLTRIRRSDDGCNYRALGEYQTTFTPDHGNDVYVTIFVR